MLPFFWIGAWLAYIGNTLTWGLITLIGYVFPPPPYISFLLESPLPELPPPAMPLWQRLLSRSKRYSRRELEAAFKAIADHPKVKGVVIHLQSVDYPVAQTEALAAMISQLQSAGKRVICWASSYTQSTYRIACGADEVLLQPGGMIPGLGARRAYFFLKEVLAGIGIEADVLQIAPYKTSPDVLTKQKLSPEAREMANWLIEAEFADLARAVAIGRGQSFERAEELIKASPYTDQQALRAGLVDALISAEELATRVEKEVVPWGSVGRRLPPPRPKPPGQYIGLIRIEGMIRDGRSRHAPLPTQLPVPLLLMEQTGDLTVVEQARRLAKDSRVAAVVVWINSGGGSAIASEAMHAALNRLAAEKPMVAVMGSVAASGGYYVATPARRIFAQPNTLTGSIGVYTGKLALGNLLDWLKIGREVIQKGGATNLHFPDRPYSEAEREQVKAQLERVYELFLERVAKGRSRSREAVEKVAGGRVWNGSQAVDNGLVDELGDLEKGLLEARRMAGLSEEVPLIELRPTGEMSPFPPPSAAEAIAYLWDAVETLNYTPAWLLCPLLPK